MSFGAYIRNIEEKTGKTPEEFLDLARQIGFVDGDGIKPGVKVGAIVEWLKKELGLGHGHAMAIIAWFKGKRA